MEGSSGKCRSCQRKPAKGRKACPGHLRQAVERWRIRSLMQKLAANPNDQLARLALRETNKRLNRINAKLREPFIDNKKIVKPEGICKHGLCRYRAMPGYQTCLNHKSVKVKH